MTAHFYDLWHCKVRIRQLDSQKGCHIHQARHSSQVAQRCLPTYIKVFASLHSKSPDNSTLFRSAIVWAGKKRKYKKLHFRMYQITRRN